MGSGSSSDGSNRGTQAQSVSQDPIAQALEQMRLDQSQQLFGNLGGMGRYGAAHPELFSFSPSEQPFYNTLTSQYSNPSGASDAGLAMMSPQERAQLASSTGALQRYADPQTAIGTAKDYFNQIVRPSSVNDSIAGGQGRSGAMDEAIATQGAGLAQNVFNNAMAAAPSLNSSLLQLSGMPRAFGSQIAQQGLGVAAMPREQQQADFLRQQGIGMSTMTGMPFVPSYTTQGQTSGQSNNKNQGYNILGGICWVAEALYGAGSADAALARLWIGYGWRGPRARLVRALYRRVGPSVARLVPRSRLLRSLLTPLFDRAVREGRAHLEASCRSC